MKKQYGILTVLLVLISSVSCILLESVPQVEATYVEGVISQDTVWFLVDSPIVLSSNVTVNPNVTLRIEPGVQVRFGGYFSLNVDGRIVAEGTSEKNIRFTTNNIVNEIMWQTILINGNLPSTMINCQIDHGTYGLTIDSGSLELRDSSMTDCMTALLVNGGSSVTVYNNTIASNLFGIELGGSLPGVINIEQNRVTNNADSGFVLESAFYDNTIITRNNVSSNMNGFLIQNSTSPEITQNYISDNIIGLQYLVGNDHHVHFNDLFDNMIGMSTSSNVTVNATYNYWGEKSGPFHPSLNPYGKGDPVDSSETDCNFIFFLSMPFDHVNQIPVANLWTDKSLVRPNTLVTFVGAESYDEGRVDQYYFDFGDGNNTGWITLSLFNHTYSSTGVYYATLYVIDDFNTISQSAPSTSITVQNLTPLTVSLVSDVESVDSSGNVSLRVYVSDGSGPVENATVTLFSVKGGAFSATAGLTDSAGYFQSMFTAPNVTELTDVRLIARASISGFADGSDFKYLKVFAPLKVHIDPQPTTVISEDEATLTVHVEEDSGEPVSDATVTISSDVGGNFSSEQATTNANGTAVFIFTAPQTTLAEGTNVTITATATKSQYGDGENSIILPIKPKVLNTLVFLPTETAYSEQKMSILVNVNYDNNPIENATVVLTSQSGNFTSSTPTDAYGNATVEFTAPLVNDSTTSIITATAYKPGYYGNPSQVAIVVNPRTFVIAIVSPPITAGDTVDVKVQVQCAEDGSNVADASVLFSLSSGETMMGTTDAEGICYFTLASHETSTQALNVTADVTKNGYTPGQQILSIPISQATGGFPLLTMLLIIIPILVAVIVAVLIKLKVIVISTKEETTGPV